MRFRILGPVSMEPRTPTAAKVRVVLAVLLVRANETVSTESLIDELWDNLPPRTASTTLQVYISQLRRVLREGDPESGPRGQRLHTISPGYTLQATDDEVDLTRFEALRQGGKAAYERADFASAASQLREGLSLWSGAALSGIPHGCTLSAAAVRLEELRMTALEQRVTADLRLGRHKELTGELMALINEHPLREALYAHLMVALFRSDRQSDALRTFAKARKALVDELGIEPGPGLRHLHERILRSDPNLAWREPVGGAAVPAVPVVRLPPALPDFVGREEAMATALRAVPDANGRASTRILVVGGRAGVGKSAFAVELARRAADRFPHGRVFVHLRGARGMALDPRQAMIRLLQQLEPGPEPGQREAADPAEDPAERLQRAVRGRRLLVILDGVSSEEQIRPLLAAIPGTFVVLTARCPLAGLDGARHLVLDVLGPKEAQQLLAEIVGPRVTEDPAAALDVARLCGYLPLGLRVAGAGLAARPHRTVAALAQRLGAEGGGLDELVAGDLDVRAILMAGYREAEEAQRAAFRLLALAPVPGFPLWSAAALLARPPDEAERIVDQLAQSHLLEVRQTGREHPPRFGYHRLLRALALDLLAEEDPVTVAAAVDRLCTAVLAAARHADAALTPGRLPHGGAEDAAEDTAHGAQADRAVEAVGANPVLWFQEECPGLVDAVRRAHAAGLRPLVWRITRCLAGYFEARAAWGEWAETHELALDAARREHDDAAEAEVLCSLGDLSWQQQRCRRAAHYFEDARTLFRQAGDQTGAARCLVGLGDVALSEAECALAGKLFADALGQCTAAGDARGRADALRGLAVVELQCGRAEEALRAFTAFADAAEELGDRRWSRFAQRTKTWILEHAAEWADGQPWAPPAVEARPGIWVVAGQAD